MKVNWGDYYWPTWLVLVSVAFAIPEGIAIVTKQWADTLSDYARGQLHASVAVTQSGIHTLAWWASFAVWLVFVVWITIHIWFVRIG